MSESTSEIPVRGLNSEKFYPYHVTAITCIGASLVGVVVILYISFKSRLYKSFFQWTLSDRFVVYIAACDGLFNLSHVLDHVQMVVTRSHVHPRNLCVVYVRLPGCRFYHCKRTTGFGNCAELILCCSFWKVGKFRILRLETTSFYFGYSVDGSLTSCSFK